MARSGLHIPITGDIKGLERAINQAHKKIGGFGKSLSGLGSVLAGAFSVAAITMFSNKALSAYQDQIRSEAKLKTALGGRTDIMKRLNKQATEMQGKTLFSDDEIINAQALLAVFIKDEEALRRLTPLVADFAQTKGVDLKSAAELIGKAFAASTNPLKRYGIELDGTAGSAERLASIQEKLTALYGGQAEAAITDQEKAVRSYRVAMDELTESVGALISKLITGSNVGLPKWIIRLADAFNAWAKYGFKNLDIAGQLDESGDQGTAMAAQAFAKAKGAKKLSTEEIRNKFLAVWEANLKSASDQLSQAEMGTPTTTMNISPEGVMYSMGSIEVNEDEVDRLRVLTEYWKNAIDYAKGYKEALSEVGGEVEDLKNKELTLADQMKFQSEQRAELMGSLAEEEEGLLAATEAQQKYAEAVIESAAAVRELVQEWKDSEEYIDDIPFDTEAIVEGMYEMADTIRNAMQAISSEVIDAFGSIVEALVAGGTDWKNIGNALLGSLGSVMQALGKQVIMMSGLMKAFDEALKTMKWQVAIGIGLALVAAGAALKGIASRGMNGVGGGGGYGGSYGTGVGYQTFADGGVVFGPTNALIGEYPGASTNPEVVAPLNKLQSILGADSIELTGAFEISGEKLVYLVNKTNTKYNRYK